MPKSRMARPSSQNVTKSPSDDLTRHIPPDESDVVVDAEFLNPEQVDLPGPDLDIGFASRVIELLGDETRVSFAKNCGFSEGALRKYLKGYRPGRDNLVAMANYRNVSVEWLATGAPPKERRALVYATMGAGKTGTSLYAKMLGDAGAMHHDGQINTDLLRLCLLTCKQVFGEEFSNALITVQLQYAAEFYNQLVQLANSKGPRADLDAFCSLDSVALTEQLRFFIKMGWARNFPADSSDKPRSADPGYGSW